MKTTVNAVKMFLIPGILFLAISPFVSSHCQVPCGIYDDQLRIDMISEHITTIEKSIKMINELSSAKEMNMNQIVRWVDNKDKHCDDLSEIVTYYFMAQRIKPVSKETSGQYDTYISQLSSLHRMMVLSMKAKQDADLAIIEPLSKELQEFSKLYMTVAKEEPQHKH